MSMHHYTFVAKSKSPLLKTSVQKLNLCLKLIRGKNLQDALYLVSSIKKNISPLISKTLLNAASNAENNGYYNLGDLYIKNVSAEKSITLRRFHPRARGKIFRVNKYYSKFYVELHIKKLKD